MTTKKHILRYLIPYSEDHSKRSSTDLRTIGGPHHQDFVISMTPKAIELWNAIVSVFSCTLYRGIVCCRKSKVWIRFFLYAGPDLDTGWIQARLKIVKKKF
jgi:hypothetical protein